MKDPCDRANIINTKGGVFVKEFFSAERSVKGFERAEKIFKMLQKCDLVKTPRPLKVEENKVYVVEGTFDLITAFRFFLNAQQDLREKALKFIHSRLRDDGIFIFNSHGNKSSMRMLVRVKKLFERDFRNSELGHKEIVDMLKRNSCILKSVFPVNYFLRFLLKLFPLSWTDFLNDCLSSRKKLEDKAVEVIYVCRKK